MNTIGQPTYPSLNAGAAPIVIATRTLEQIRVLPNDERRALWASRYFLVGQHRNPTFEGVQQ